LFELGGILNRWVAINIHLDQGSIEIKEQCKDCANASYWYIL
jgi:hypothetical protein